MLKIVVGLLIYTSFTSANAQENVLEVYKNYVDFLSKNDTVISQNIANADTPKYLPKKLEDKKILLAMISNWIQLTLCISTLRKKILNINYQLLK